MRSITRRSSFVCHLALAALAACSEAGPPQESARVAVSVAPLSLPGIVEACYALSVTNAPGGAGDTVWTQGNLCSTRYGDGRGAISFVGPCDADGDGANTVILELLSIEDAAGPAAFVNPCGAPDNAPCRLEVACRENADVPVEFNLTVMRPAQQGFFDVAVNFEDVFCSAKWDTCHAATEGGPANERNLLLFGDGRGEAGVVDGEGRDWTGVFAFACTGGPGQDIDTELLFSAVVLECPTFVVSLPIADHDQGNNAVLVDLDGDDAPTHAVQYGLYYGAELLRCHDGTTGETQPCNKSYLNLAIDLDDLPAGCVLSLQATAQGVGAPGSADQPAPALQHGVIARTGATYPFVDVDAVATDACAQHSLDDGGPVATFYGTSGDFVGGVRPDPMCTSSLDGDRPTAIANAECGPASERCDPAASPFGGGAGTLDDPFRVCARDHLANVGGAPSAYFRQVVDLDLADAPFAPIGSDTVGFSGDYDGAGHTIGHLTWHEPNAAGSVALFRAIAETGVVHDVHLVAVELTGNNLVGGVAGFNWGAIRDVSVQGTLLAKGCIGGIAAKQEKLGASDPEITRAVVDATIYSTTTGDRIINIEPASAEKDDCGAAGIVSTMIGGIVQDCHVDGTISFDPIGPGHADVWTWTGGVAGYARRNSVIRRCTTEGFITGRFSVGGIVGGFEGNGAAQGVIDSTSLADVRGQHRVGGIAGVTRKPVVRSRALGAVTGQTVVGGLIGHQIGERASASFATGDVSGVDMVGGLIGLQEDWDGNAEVDDAYATGRVLVAEGGRAGGFVGVASARLNRCYSAAPRVGPSSAALAFIGGGAPTITDSYFHDNGAVTPQVVSGVTALSTAAMTQQASFNGFAFTTAGGLPEAGCPTGFCTVWSMPSANPGAALLSPVLSWQCGADGVVCQ